MSRYKKTLAEIKAIEQEKEKAKQENTILEPCFNLYYAFENETEFKVIFALAGRMYNLEGTEESKLKFLSEKSTQDYLNVHVKIMLDVPEIQKEGAFLHFNGLSEIGFQSVGFERRLQAFESVFQRFEQKGIAVPVNPLVCITPCLFDLKTKTLKPSFNKIVNWNCPTD